MKQETVKVLFVCMGNICRSPAGEGVFKHLLEEAGLSERVEVDSAGTIAFHSGHAADSRMRAAANKRGIELTSIARKIVFKDLETFDFIIIMDDENYEGVRGLDKPGKYADKIKRLVSYCTTHTDKEVPDPYYGGDQGFEHVLDLLEDGCAGLLEAVRERLA